MCSEKDHIRETGRTGGWTDGRTDGRKEDTHLLKEASRILTDLGKAWYDVVEVEIAEGGMVTTLTLHLSQQ